MFIYSIYVKSVLWYQVDKVKQTEAKVVCNIIKSVGLWVWNLKTCILVLCLSASEAAFWTIRSFEYVLSSIQIVDWNGDVERVKIDQERLSQELDFILAQQKELEDMLGPLETSVDQLPPITYQQHADLEREHT